MGNHYYTNDPIENKKEHTFAYTYQKSTLKFQAGSGVFSKKGIDFGTHVLLQALPTFEDAQDVLDVGCGVGVVGLSIAKVYPQIHVDLVDVNVSALAYASQNATTNKIKNVAIFESDVYQNINKLYDCVITNPPIRAGKAVVDAIVLGAKEYLKKGGMLWLVIAKKQGAPSMMKRIQEVYGNCEVVSKESGYFVLTACNTSV